MLFLGAVGNGGEQRAGPSRPPLPLGRRRDEPRLFEKDAVRADRVGVQAENSGELVDGARRVTRAEVLEQSGTGRVGQSSMMEGYSIHALEYSIRAAAEHQRFPVRKIGRLHDASPFDFHDGCHENHDNPGRTS